MTAAADAAAAPALRVVVVTFSPGQALEGFLDSLAGATSSPYDVVLADNGSTDGAPEQAEAAGRARLLHTGGNVGYGAAANLGARGAAGEWLLVANPDITFTPGSLDLLLAATRDWPRAGAFGPAIRTPDGQLYPSARAFPTLGPGIGHALLGWRWPSNRWTAAYRRERGEPSEGPTGWLSGSCLLVRREAFEAVGGFDESYFMYFEDLDLCQRLAEAGWPSIYVPGAVVTHLGGHATMREPRRMLAAHHRSAYRYLSRRYRGLRWAWLRPFLGLGLAGRYLVARWLRPVGEGARPTRSADVLRPAEPVRTPPEG